MDPMIYLHAKYRQYEQASARFQWRHLTSRRYLIVVGVVTVLLQGVSVVSDGENKMLLVGVSIASAVCAASATFVTLIMGLRDAARLWVANRTGAEALKTEAFLYAAGAPPYDGSNAMKELEQRIIDIEIVVGKLADGKGDA